MHCLVLGKIIFDTSAKQKILLESSTGIASTARHGLMSSSYAVAKIDSHFGAIDHLPTPFCVAGNR